MKPEIYNVLTQHKVDIEQMKSVLICKFEEITKRLSLIEQELTIIENYLFDGTDDE